MSSVQFTTFHHALGGFCRCLNGHQQWCSKTSCWCSSEISAIQPTEQNVWKENHLSYASTCWAGFLNNQPVSSWFSSRNTPLTPQKIAKSITHRTRPLEEPWMVSGSFTKFTNCQFGTWNVHLLLSSYPLSSTWSPVVDFFFGQVFFVAQGYTQQQWITMLLNLKKMVWRN